MADTTASKKRKRDGDVKASEGRASPRAKSRCVAVPLLKSMVLDEWCRLPLPDRMRCIAFVPDGPLLDDMIDRIRDEQKQQRQALWELRQAVSAVHADRIIGECREEPTVECPRCDMEVECNEDQLSTDEVERRLKKCHSKLLFAVAKVETLL